MNHVTGVCLFSCTYLNMNAQIFEISILHQNFIKKKLFSILNRLLDYLNNMT